MAFIRRVRTASGATAVQIAYYVGGRQRIVKHLGSAHTEAELGVLLQQLVTCWKIPPSSSWTSGSSRPRRCGAGWPGH